MMGENDVRIYYCELVAGWLATSKTNISNFKLVTELHTESWIGALTLK